MTTTSIDPFAPSTEMPRALAARDVSAVELLAQDLGGLRRPPGYDEE